MLCSTGSLQAASTQFKCMQGMLGGGNHLFLCDLLSVVLRHLHENMLRGLHACPNAHVIWVEVCHEVAMQACEFQGTVVTGSCMIPMLVLHCTIEMLPCNATIYYAHVMIRMPGLPLCYILVLTLELVTCSMDPATSVMCSMDPVAVKQAS